MKKFIALTLSVVMLITGSAMSFAEETTGKQGDKVRQETFQAGQKNVDELKNVPQPKFENKKAEFRAFFEALNAKRKEAIAAMKASNKIRNENARLMADLRSALESMKEDGVELKPEVLAQLEEYKNQIKAIKEEIRATKDQIKDVLKEHRTHFMKDKDYAAMEAAFAEIAVVQKFRNDSLVEINNILKAMLQLLVVEVDVSSEVSSEVSSSVSSSVSSEVSSEVSSVA